MTWAPSPAADAALIDATLAALREERRRAPADLLSIVVQPDPRPPAVRESERYGQRRGPGCLTRGAGRPGTIWIDNGSNRDVL
jgi:hypothetical protein